jgi:hypothetical protein
MLKTSEPTTKKPSSLIFNSFTLNPKGNSLKINELFKVPFRGFRGYLHIPLQKLILPS